MNAIIFSDMHFYNNPAKSYIMDSGRFSWFETQLQVAQSVFTKAEELGVELVIHNGDLFHEKTRISVGLYNTVWQFFKQQKNEGFEVIFNTGNHDMFTRNVSSLRPFSEIARVITEPTLIKHGHINLCLIPYGQEPNQLKVPKENTGMSYILCTHADIAGLTYGVTDYTSGSPLKYQIFGDWDIVFNGHIHKPQELANIVNIGSPMTQDWGEVGEKKRFIHLKDLEWESHEIHGPQFVTLDRLTDKLKKKLITNPVDFFRVDISSEQLSDPIFNQYNIFPRVTKVKKRELRLRDTSSIEEEMSTYVDIIDTKLDKNKLRQIGTDIYNENN